MAIPIERPVTGYDLENLRRRLGLSVEDMRWVLGMNINRWSKHTHKQPDAPLQPALGLLVRFYDENPDEVPVPRAPTASEIYTALGTSLKDVGIMLGRESVSGFRWIQQDGEWTPTIDRLAYHLMRELEAGNEQEWRERVLLEGQARGVSDIFKEGTWNKKPSKKSATSPRPTRARATTKKSAGTATKRKASTKSTKKSASA